MSSMAVRIGALTVALTLTVAPDRSQGETLDELDDAAARLQYAFYTSDVRSLEEVLALIDGFQVDDALAAPKAYQLAYGYWKLALLYAVPEERPRPNARSLASKAAQTCVKQAQAAIAKDARLAEAYAIEAICDGFPPTRNGAPACRGKSLKTATSLAPANPRVQLIDALCSAPTTADPASVEKWRAIVAAFEAAPPSRPGKPDWGHAEALAQLGECYLQRGDTVAARDVLERALVLAPDYRQAQKLLQTAATRPR